MNRILPLVSLAAWLSVSPAQAETPAPISVGVLNFSGPQRTLAKNISALLVANLSTDEHFLIVERAELDKVLGEQALGGSGGINRDTAAKIGQLTGARVLVSGRELMPNGPHNVVIIANVIGTETGKTFSQTCQGPRTNVVALVAELSQKISQTILEQSTNLVAATAGNERQSALDRLAEQTRGKKLPSVLVRIDEKSSSAATHTAQIELGSILQKAGFTVVDEHSAQQPDIVITGDAISGDAEKRGDLMSCPATVSIKAQERVSGRIVSLDLQQSTAVGVGDATTRQQGLQNAIDDLARRLVPALAR